MSLTTLTDVTAVRLFREYIFAGIGSYVNVFNRCSGQLIQRLHVLKAQKIYGIIPIRDATKILVFGGKQFAVLTVEGETLAVAATVFCNDWLHAGVWTNDSNVAILTAHNVVQQWNTSNQQQISVHKSKNLSLLYSGFLHPLKDDILVFAGTVFSEVLVECCGSAETLHALKGHRGVIFSICYDEKKQLIVSTSDDRSVRIWGPQTNISQPPNTIEYWRQVSIDCKHEVYGHSARVMRSIISGDHVISVGEDSGICFWSLDGKLDRKVTAHQNGCIWSVSADNEFLVTGGGDGGVMRHPLTVASDYAQCNTLNLIVNSPKKIAFTARNNVVILTEHSQLIYYDAELKQATKGLKLKHESTYILLSISSCKQIIAVIDIEGNLDVFTENCRGEPDIIHILNEKVDFGKVLSLQWAGNRHFVICSEGGKITVLASKGSSTELYAKFVLPSCKERWLTASAIDSTGNIFVVGDRCGNIHVYTKDHQNPLKTFPKVHGRYGPTSISIRSNKVTTTGRDGAIKYFSIQDKMKPLASKDVPFEWVGKFLDRDENIICGFQERVFVVYDVKNNVQILDVPCGGGHRSWDAVRYIEKVNEDYEEFIKLLYVKNSALNEVKFQLKNIVSKNIVQGTHVKEINCLSCFKCQLLKPEMVFISGGEDTTVRITKVNITTKESNDEILYKHLSNVRALKTIEIEPNKFMLVTAGGRAQIIIKLIEISKRNDNIEIKTESLIDHMIKGSDKQRKGNKPWKSREIDFDPETRIIDIEIIRNGDNFLIFAGCSDTYLRIFELNLQTCIFKQIQEILYHKTCILKTKTFVINKRNILATCTTRGIVTFWDVTDINKDLKPIFETITNKAGVNSVEVKVLSDNEFIIACGGDDNAVVLNKIEVTDEVKILETVIKENFHHSQITGLRFVNDNLISTSIDQRVTKARIERGPLKCEFADQWYIDIADIQGMDIVDDNSDKTVVCVFGKGLEVIQIS